MNPVTGAVPPLVRGHGIRFEVDRWTWRRLDAARFDGERRHLLATRGRPWHADPRHGGDTDALETWRLLAGRVLLQCLFDRFGSVFPQCGLMVFPGVVIVSR